MKCHYVPQLYLSHWGNEKNELRSSHWGNKKNELRSYEIVRNKVIKKSVTPAQVCYEKNLYVFDAAGEQYREFLETHVFNKHIETHAAPIMDKLIQMKEDGDFDLSTDESSDWSRFILSMLLRMPEIIHRLKTVVPSQLRKELNDANEEYQRLAPDDAPRKFSDWVDLTKPGYLEQMAMNLVPSILFEGDNPKHIHGMKWWMLDFSNTSIELLTCDRPCMLYGRDKVDEEALFALPLSPHRLFLAANDRKFWDSKIGSVGLGQFGRHVNIQAMISCKRWIFGSLRGAMDGLIHNNFLKIKNPT